MFKVGSVIADYIINTAPAKKGLEEVERTARDSARKVDRALNRRTDSRVSEGLEKAARSAKDAERSIVGMVDRSVPGLRTLADRASSVATTVRQITQTPADTRGLTKTAQDGAVAFGAMAASVNRLKSGADGVAESVQKIDRGTPRQLPAVVAATQRSMVGLGQAAQATFGRLTAGVLAFLNPLRLARSLLFSIQGALLGFGVFRFVQLANEAETLRLAFRALNASINETATTTLDALRRATRGTVSDLALMRTANNAILLGVADSAETFELLGTLARRLGQAVGIDAVRAFDNLATGIGRQSRLVLDNLGLIVKVADANEAYARALGKSVDELTDSERRQAFMNATLDAARTKLRDLGEDVETVASQWGRLRASVSNVAVQLAEVFVTGSLARSLSGFIERNQASIVAFGRALSDLGAKAIDAASKIIEAFRGGRADLSGAIGNFLAGQAVSLTQFAAEAITKAIPAIVELAGIAGAAAARGFITGLIDALAGAGERLLSDNPVSKILNAMASKAEIDVAPTVARLFKRIFSGEQVLQSITAEIGNAAATGGPEFAGKFLAGVASEVSKDVAISEALKNQTNTAVRKSLDDIAGVMRGYFDRLGENISSSLTRLLGQDEADAIRQSFDGVFRRLEADLSGVQRTIGDPNIVEALRAQADELQRAIDLQFELFSQGKITREELEKQVSAIQAQAAALEDQSAALRQAVRVDSFQEQVRSAREALSQLGDSSGAVDRVRSALDQLAAASERLRTTSPAQFLREFIPAVEGLVEKTEEGSKSADELRRALVNFRNTSLIIRADGDFTQVAEDLERVAGQAEIEGSVTLALDLQALASDLRKASIDTKNLQSELSRSGDQVRSSWEEAKNSVEGTQRQIAGVEGALARVAATTIDLKIAPELDPERFETLLQPLQQQLQELDTQVATQGLEEFEAALVRVDRIVAKLSRENLSESQARQLETVATKIRALSEQFRSAANADKLQKTVESLTERTAALQTQLEELSASDLDRKLSSLDREFQKIASDLPDVSVSKVREEFSKLRDLTVALSFAEVIKQNEDLADSLDKIANSTSGDAFRRTREEVEGIGDALVKAAQSNLGKRFGDLSLQLDDVASSGDVTQRVVGLLRAEIASLENLAPRVGIDVDAEGAREIVEDVIHQIEMIADANEIARPSIDRFIDDIRSAGEQANITAEQIREIQDSLRRRIELEGAVEYQQTLKSIREETSRAKDELTTIRDGSFSTEFRRLTEDASELAARLQLTAEQSAELFKEIERLKQAKIEVAIESKIGEFSEELRYAQLQQMALTEGDLSAYFADVDQQIESFAESLGLTTTQMEALRASGEKLKSTRIDVEIKSNIKTLNEELDRARAQLEAVGQTDVNIRIADINRQYTQDLQNLIQAGDAVDPKKLQELNRLRLEQIGLAVQTYEREQFVELANGFGDAVYNGIIAGLTRSEDPFKAFLNTVIQYGNQQIAKVIDNLTSAVGVALQKIFQSAGVGAGAAGIVGGLVGVAAAILQNIESRSTSAVENFGDTVSSASAIRGVVAGPSNVAISQVSEGLREAMRTSEELLARIADATERTAAAQGGAQTGALLNNRSIRNSSLPLTGATRS